MKMLSGNKSPPRCTFSKLPKKCFHLKFLFYFKNLTQQQQRVILKDQKAQVYHSVGQCWVRSDFSMAETWDQG